MKYDPRQAIENLDKRLIAIETQLGELLKNHLPHLDAKLELLTKQMSGRPSWSIMWLISFLSSIVAVLVSIVLRK